MTYAHARHECVVADHVKHRRQNADGGCGILMVPLLASGGLVVGVDREGGE